MKPAHLTPLRMLIVGLIFISGVIALIVGVKYAHRIRERKFQALFAGPCEVVQVADRTHYPRCVYDLRAYESYAKEYSFSETEAAMPFPAESKPRDLEWVEGAAREHLEAMIRQRRTVDAITGATVVLRLQSPTVYRARRPSQLLRISYPADGAVFPPNLCEPCVEWDDAINDLWQVTVGISGMSLQWSFVTTQRRWWFPPEVWHVIQGKAVEHDAYIQVKGVRREAGGAIQASQRVRFCISRWPADEAIVYRLVAPPFNSRKTPDTFVRDIRSFQTRFFLLGRRKYCFNCHTFSSKSGTSGRVGLQVRYMAGGYELPVYFGVYDIEEKRGWKVRLPFDIQMTTFMAWAPDEQKLAFSANQQIVAFSPIVHETQFAGEPTSDIAIYDMSQETAYLLPGASDPDLLEIYPRWSPDGESIVYCSAPPGVHPEQVHYNLWVIPFNKGRGGLAKPIPGAFQNERSNYYPRYSPDGKWLSFCQSLGGDLIRSSSDIYLLPGDLEGPAHCLECNVDYAADSWHSWSSNGRWLVFASKRDDGIYARLYLT
ncbi:MAG: PD40 domain-containing protein, partial [Candidatus Latescibacteria bacterium]|nr:PD40 domain-containing protein [Candidatus Latescibacterota bacterium]